ncbi:MAG TPA: universal stress protein [Candidatus Nitrosotenuis sp.]|nr:universal stress protein [Candidatus Nitrosotenuis sp.]
MYKTILVPYDGSKPSEKALKHAVSLAKLMNSTILLLNVIPEIIMPPFAAREAAFGGKSIKEHLKELYYDMKNDAQKILDAKKTEFGGQTKIQTMTSLGRPSEKILETIKEKNPDLVIMGTTGLSGISKILGIGSVARNVAEKSPCPVLLIH